MEIPQALPHWSQRALPKPQIGLLHDLLKTFNSFPILLGRPSPTSLTGLQDLAVSCPCPLSGLTAGNSPNPISTVPHTRHMHTSTYVHMHTQTYTLMYMSTHTHTHGHKHIHACTQKYMNTVYIHTNKCTYRGLIRTHQALKSLKTLGLLSSDSLFTKYPINFP